MSDKDKILLRKIIIILFGLAVWFVPEIFWHGAAVFMWFPAFVVVVYLELATDD